MKEKSDRPGEQEMLFHSLPPPGEDWVEREERLLGKRKECPTNEVIAALVQQQPVEDAERLLDHVRGCRFCTFRETSFRAGWTAPREEFVASAQRAAWLKKHQRPFPPKPPGAETRVKGFTIPERPEPERRKSVADIEPALANVLEFAGLDPIHKTDFTQFLLDVAPSKGSSLPDWLRSFAQEKLGLTDLPRHANPAEWVQIPDLCAMHKVKASSGNEGIKRVLQKALEKGCSSLERLQVLREENLSESEYLNAAYLEVRPELAQFRESLGLPAQMLG